ncbi:Syntaxin-6 [Coelomomyces lativittatus]|nr:Syntaxin-6 [Coelomomyces lativittatus]
MAQSSIPLNSYPTNIASNSLSIQQDPYFQVKINVTETINKTKDQALEYLNLPLNTPIHQINQKLSQLQSQLLTIQNEIEDIQDSIQIVEQHPHRFKISKDEMNNRKLFLEWCKTNLNEIQNTKLKAQSKFEKYQRDSLLKTSPKQPARMNSIPLISNNGSELKSASFIETHTGHQQVIIKQQDEQLNSVLHTVTNMKEVALTMGQELDDQVGYDVDHF